MIKKIILISTLTSTLLVAETMKEKGFFIGLDASTSSVNIAYEKKGSIIRASNYESDDRTSNAALKVGYQYYFTRVYLRINPSKTYKDQTSGYYEIKNQVVEMNIDYLPIFYIQEEQKWNIRGVVGLGIGVNKNGLVNYSKQNIDVYSNTADPILNKETQYNMEYGYNIGLMSEFDFGLSAEIGYRFRTGLMGEYSDAVDGEGKTSYEAIFTLSTGEFYLGLNYLF